MNLDLGIIDQFFEANFIQKRTGGSNYGFQMSYYEEVCLFNGNLYTKDTLMECLSVPYLD